MRVSANGAFLARARATTMGDDTDRKRIIDRADRMLKQSRTLRRISDELLSESRDIRNSAERVGRDKKSPSKRPRTS